MILLIDNYDSFSYNLYQLIGGIKASAFVPPQYPLPEGAGLDPAPDLIGGINPDIRVVRNDAISLADIAVLKPSHIFISPGPGKPADAGVCEKVIASFAGLIPIFGVCLGHQAICEVFGATVTYAKNLMHGKASAIRLDRDCPVFAGLPERIQGGRYHSLAADPATIPAALKVTALTDEGEVMAVSCAEKLVYGVQFHPESILTPEGKRIVSNFLAM
jgi:anthranilate synthase component 2